MNVVRVAVLERVLYVCAVCALMFFSAASVEAATLYFDPHNAEVKRGDTITVAVRLDTEEGECVNAISANISYPNAINAIDITRGNSIFSLWVEEPTIHKEDNTITFAGGIPNGYCGRVSGDPRLTNTIAELVFRAPGLTVGASDTDGVATLAFLPDTQVLLHDGFGTPADLQTFETSIYLLEEVGGGLDDEWRDRIQSDTVPPEEFSITLAKDDIAFNQKYYISFNTTDKQSGIDHYQVIEEPSSDQGIFSWGAVDAPWIETRSPFVLADQTLNSVIRVKAIDKAGNEYIATLVPDESLRVKQFNAGLAVMIGIGLLVVLLSAAIVWWFMRRQKQRLEDEYEE